MACDGRTDLDGHTAMAPRWRSGEALLMAMAGRKDALKDLSELGVSTIAHRI